MPHVLIKALVQGTSAPLFTARMADRKLRWQLLRRPTPFPFNITDKVGMKAFAEQHGVGVASTVAVLDSSKLSSGDKLRAEMERNWPDDFVLKPTHGFQNKNTYAVRRRTEELLRGGQFDVDAAAAAIGSDGGLFPTYMVEELLVDERDADSAAAASGGTAASSPPTAAAAALPIDYKFWCFGSTIAHCTIMVDRWREGDAAYTVAVADCDAEYNPQPSWCALPSDAESGLVEYVDLPPRPKCWDEMVQQAKTLGDAVGAFSRIDFYATTKGPVFGEFQLLFDLVDWNENADDAIRRHWRGRDGAG